MHVKIYTMEYNTCYNYVEITLMLVLCSFIRRLKKLGDKNRRRLYYRRIYLAPHSAAQITISFLLANSRHHFVFFIRMQ